MRSLAVYLNARQVGTLKEADTLWRFEYDPSWAASPEGFDLSPALPRAVPEHVDGASLRPVQWYFDNLLPEEGLREAVSREAGLQGDDAFALLEYLGAESAGSLSLLPPGQPLPGTGGLRPLPDAELCGRIRRLPRSTLSSAAPKRMLVAGAQHKLLVVYRQGQLFEPVGMEPSTHMLKPNHPDADYACSVVNEYFSMRLAAALGLAVPRVQRRYTPEPVYIVERFDRDLLPDQPAQRRHVIDACQLLNKARDFKHSGATLESLAALVQRCRNRIHARLGLYRWLAFNLLIGNHDNHLKNLSFLTGPQGIALAPSYDLLSTAVYETRAFADERATWPGCPLAIPLPGARRFDDVRRAALLEAAEPLGLPRRIAQRELQRMLDALPSAMQRVLAAIDAENAGLHDEARTFLAGEQRLLRSVQKTIVAEMLARLG